MERNDRPTIAGALALCAFILAISLLNAAKWVMLNGAVTIPMGATWMSRLAGTATFLVFIALYRDRPPAMKLQLGVVAILMAAYVVILYVVAASTDAVLISVLQYLSSLLYGVADAIFILVFCQVLTVFTPARAAIIFGVEQALSNALVFGISLFSAGAAYHVRAGAIVLGVLLLVLLARPTLAYARQKTATCDEEDWDAVSARVPEDAFPATPNQWGVFFLAVFLFNGIFGVIAQVNSLGGDSFGLYDVYTSIIVVTVAALLVVFLRLNPKGISFPLVVAVVSLMLATGLLLFLNGRTSTNPLAGVLIRSGYDFAFILFAALMAAKCFAAPQRVILYAGAYFCAHITSVYVGRIVGAALMSGQTSPADVLTTLSQVLLWVLFAVGVVGFYLVATRNTAAGALDTRGDGEGVGEGAVVVDPAIAAEVLATEERTAAFREFMEQKGLSQREVEVLEELLRGQNRAAIAKRLYLSPETVKSHVRRIYMKFGVSSKQELLDLLEAKHLL